jgi:hypothetical protein
LLTKSAHNFFKPIDGKPDRTSMKETRSRFDRKAAATISTGLFAIGTMPAPHDEVAAARIGGPDIPRVFSATSPAVDAQWGGHNRPPLSLVRDLAKPVEAIDGTS